MKYTPNPYSETPELTLNTSLADSFKSPTLPSDNIFSFTKDTLDNLPPVLTGWIKLYLRLQMEGVRADRTVNSVRLDLEKFQTFFESYTSSDNITFWTAQVTKRFLDHLEHEKKLKPATVSRILTSLRSFSKWLNKKRPDFFNLGNPTNRAKPPIQEALKPKSLTRKQTKQLLDAAQNLILIEEARLAKKENKHSIHRPKRDLAILTVLLNAGLRREEVCNLKIGQLKSKRFENVKCKGNLYRNVFIGEKTAEAIQMYIQTERKADAETFDSDYLFLPSSARKTSTMQGILSTKAIFRIIEKLSKTASAHLKDEDKFIARPHMLRHTHAYRMLEEGRSETYVKDRLGHQTMNYVARYTKMPEEDEMALINSVEEV